jgi:deazaflavin-dependent oxidoreductase (nitroreductase family)
MALMRAWEDRIRKRIQATRQRATSIMNDEEAARLRESNELVRPFNEQVISEFRASKGIVGGHFAPVRLLLLHHVGRRSGKEYVLPLLYLRDGDSFILAGSNGGAEREPAWVSNLEGMSETTIEVGEEILTVRPESIREPTSERERLYARLVDYWPDFLKYGKNTDRQFPLIRLHPIGQPAPR